MVDFVLKLYQEIHNTEDVPRGMSMNPFGTSQFRLATIPTDRMLHLLEFAEKKEKVLAQLEEFQTQTQNIIEVIENPEVIAALRQDKLQNLHFLKENYNVR
jgi:translation initiation factor 3 subunit E